MSTTTRDDGAPSASQPIPTLNAPYWKQRGQALTWPGLFATAPPVPADQLAQEDVEVVAPIAVVPDALDAVWQPVEPVDEDDEEEVNEDKQAGLGPEEQRQQGTGAQQHQLSAENLELEKLLQRKAEEADREAATAMPEYEQCFQGF
jgi:hypothetical protein